ncbi:hypothetical protein VTN49DRAFT_1338 [Thermomyces lanuginosus]|uniref:uncharacterized protein n=1 Tax=Thermomyces lanuginosus TaxID=5541 RepID=UPI00374433E7
MNRATSTFLFCSLPPSYFWPHDEHSRASNVKILSSATPSFALSRGITRALCLPVLRLPPLQDKLPSSSHHQASFEFARVGDHHAAVS